MARARENETMNERDFECRDSDYVGLGVGSRNGHVSRSRGRIVIYLGKSGHVGPKFTRWAQF